MIDRRTLLMATAAFGAVAATGKFGEAGTMNTATTTTQDIDWKKLTDAQWRKRLTPAQYNVLRNHGTERPGSSPLLREHRKGTFACAGCALPLFSSAAKFESGTAGRAFMNRCRTRSRPRPTAPSS